MFYQGLEISIYLKFFVLFCHIFSLVRLYYAICASKINVNLDGLCIL